MKKKILLRSAFGVPLGITTGYLISILVSLIWAKGSYISCEQVSVQVPLYGKRKIGAL